MGEFLHQIRYSYHKVILDYFFRFLVGATPTWLASAPQLEMEEYFALLNKDWIKFFFFFYLTQNKCIILVEISWNILSNPST